MMTKKKAKYDSYFEETLHKGALSKCQFHPKRVPYIIHWEREYEPDFKVGNVLIEAKGRFRDRMEANKYLWIRQALPKGTELVFVLMNAKASMPGSRRRKNGTRYSISEWCDRHDFVWYTPRTTPRSWSKKK